MALCTSADVEGFLGLNLASEDATQLTERYIPYVDEMIKNFIGYEIEFQTTITETFNGENKEYDLFLSNQPVTAIASITEDGTTLTQGNESDYVFYANGLVTRVGVRWSDAKLQNIVVTYSAGYTVSNMPDDIKYTAARAVARMYLKTLQISGQQGSGEIKTHLADSDNGGNFNMVSEETIGSYKVQYGDLPDVNLSEEVILTNHDRVVLSKYKTAFFV
tara:strand:+ start:741 stop:1397 length:657 start_codon:yes stop_codon:yes gene_type:complete